MSFRSVVENPQTRKLLPLAIQASTRLGAAFLTVKVITAFLAPAQFVIYGQLQTLMQVCSAVSTSIASTKFSALIARAGNPHERAKIADTAIFLIAAVTILLLCLTLLFKDQVQKFISVEGHGLEVIIQPVGAFAIAYTALLQAYFTGLGDAVRFGRNSVASILLVTITTIALTSIFGFGGALFSITASPILACAAIALLDNPLKQPKVENVDFATGKEITGFTLASILSLVGYYCAQLFIRGEYANSVSAHQAGLLTAAIRISDVYMGVLAVLYANILTKHFGKVAFPDRAKQIGKIYLAFGVIGFSAFSLLAITRNFWVPLLLSSQYIEASDHMLMQLCGDFLKCMYWIPLYYVISKHSSLTYFVFEVSGLLIYTLLATLNPFESERFAPQIAQIVEYFVLILAVNALVIVKKHE